MCDLEEVDLAVAEVLTLVGPGLYGCGDVGGRVTVGVLTRKLGWGHDIWEGGGVCAPCGTLTNCNYQASESAARASVGATSWADAPTPLRCDWEWWKRGWRECRQLGHRTKTLLIGVLRAWQGLGGCAPGWCGVRS